MGIFKALYDAIKSNDQKANITELEQTYEKEISVLHQQIKDLNEQISLLSKQNENHLNLLSDSSQKEEQLHNMMRSQLVVAQDQFSANLEALTADFHRQLKKMEINNVTQVKNLEVELNSLRKENERLKQVNESTIDKIHGLEAQINAFDQKKIRFEHQMERKYEAQLDEMWEKNRKLLLKNDALKEQLQQATAQNKEIVVKNDLPKIPDNGLKTVQLTNNDLDKLVAEALKSTSVSKPLGENILEVPKQVENHISETEVFDLEIEDIDEELPEEVVASLNNVVDSFYANIELKKPKQLKSIKHHFFDRRDEFEYQYVDKTVREIKSKMPKDLPSRYQVADYFEAGWHNYGVKEIHMQHASITSLKEQANRPYFGRMDIYNGGAGGNTYYVGIQSMGNHIISWKTEAASIYYEKNIGQEVVHPTLGNVKLDYLRQIDIDNCRIQRLHPPMEHEDSIDHSLQHTLASKRGQDMEVIVATIQKEQNELIRLPIQKPIIIQGSAGSGKSVIALHRLSYLLYKYKTLKENSVAIFAPNKLFLEHIRKVLPELGNYKIIQTTFKEYSLEQLNLKREKFPKYSGINRTAVVHTKGSMAYKDYIEYYAEQVLNNVKPWIATFSYNNADVEIVINGIDLALYYEELNLSYHNRKNKMVNWLSQQVNEQLQMLMEIGKQKNELTHDLTNNWLPQLHTSPYFDEAKGLDESIFGKEIINQLNSLKKAILGYGDFSKSNYLDLYVNEMKQNLDIRKENSQTAIEKVISNHVENLSAEIDILLEYQLNVVWKSMVDSWVNNEMVNAEQQFIQQHLRAKMNMEPKIITSLKAELDKPAMLSEKKVARSLFNEQKQHVLREKYKLEIRDNIKAFMLYQVENSWNDGVSNMLQRTMDLMFHFKTNHPKPNSPFFESSVYDIQKAIESFVNQRLELSTTDLLEYILQDAFRIHGNDLFELPQNINTELLHDAYDKTKTRGKLSWLRYEDLPALLHLEMLMKGESYNRPLSYLILDEAQDYMPYEAFIMSRLTTSNGLMLIGDLGQNLNEASDVVNWDVYKDFLNTPSYYELQATYRSTKQIVEMSNQIIRPFSKGKYNLSEQTYREGMDVKWLSTTKVLLPKLIQHIVKEIERRSANYESIAIISKTLEDAVRLKENLPIGLEAEIQTEEHPVKSKVIITTPLDAKGLEFDCIIIEDLSEYEATDYDRKLAYVATSRALHELHIFHTKSVEHFIE